MSGPGPRAAAGPAAGPWRRRRFGIAVLAVFAVVLAGIAYLAATVDVGGGSPSAAVAGYLQALARGDAAGALAAGSAPADRSLLTDKVLAEQQRLAPISDIRVLGTSRGDYGAVVQVTYRMGDRLVEDRINVVPANGDWRLTSVAVDVEMAGRLALPKVTVFGRPVPVSRDIFVFPGAVPFGSVNPNFATTPATALITSPNLPALISVGSALTDAGRANAAAAITDGLASCAASRSLAPPGCPQAVPRPAGAVTGSWRWSVAGVAVHGLTQDQRNPRLVAASATVEWRLDYQVLVKRKPVAKALSVRTPVTGTVDYTQSPPTFTRATG